MSSAFFLLNVFSWTLVGFIAVFSMYGWDDEAYEFGKIAAAFMVGAMVGMVVI